MRHTAWRRYAATVIVLGFLLALSGMAMAKGTLDSIRERGELVVGVRQNQVGFSYENEKGQLVGFEVDLGKYIADKLGVNLKTVPVTGSTRIPLLTQGRVDLLAATLSHYRTRDDVVDFSIGYFFASLKVMVKKASGITTLDELDGRRVGTVAGAGSLEQIPERVPGVKMQAYESYQDAFLALQRGIIDGVGTDYPVLAGLRAQAPDPEDYVFIDEPYGGSEFGMGMRENDSKWRDYVNYAIQDAWLDGTWQELFNKWLGPDTKFKMRPEELGWKVPLWAVPMR